jgi:hypothetical protein
MTLEKDGCLPRYSMKVSGSVPLTASLIERSEWAYTDIFTPMSWTLSSAETPDMPSKIDNGVYTLVSTTEIHVQSRNSDIASEIWFTTPVSSLAGFSFLFFMSKFRRTDQLSGNFRCWMVSLWTKSKTCSYLLLLTTRNVFVVT